MRYILISTEFQGETQTKDEEYSVKIRLEIKDTESIADNFFRYLDVISSNESTGYEVDEQRETEINNYLKSIN
jgi:hypothetical protein